MSIIEHIEAKIDELYAQIKSIQTKCSHPAECVEKIAKCADGDYYNKDYYYYDCTCKLCHKKWTEDQ